MKRYQFTEEARWKDLIPSDAPRFAKTIQLKSVDARPPDEHLIKLFDNSIYDIVLQKLVTIDGNLEIGLYLSFKRDARLLIATMVSGIWKINETNRYNEFATFGQIWLKYGDKVVQALYHLCNTHKPSKTNLERYLYIFFNRTLKQYFI